MVVSAKEKRKWDCIRECGWGSVAILDGVDKEDLIKEEAFTQRTEGGERSQGGYLGKSIPSRGKGKCKGPEVGVCQAHLRNN